MLSKNIFIGVFAVASIAGCKKVDFGDYNFNPAPDRISKPQTADLLTNAIWNSVGGLNLTAMEPNCYVQYVSQTQYPDISLYQTTQRSWAGYYATPLQDLAKIIELNTTSPEDPNVSGNGSANNQIAIATILKSFLFHMVTDQWGDVPFSQALNANKLPKYDLQSAIYPALIADLKSASAKMDGGAAIKGDILFGGNLASWKRFANSLRMVISMRAVKANATWAKTEFLAAFNDAAGHITTNAQNATFTFLASGYQNPLNGEFGTRQDYGVSNTFVDLLKGLADPRIATMCTKPGADYKGVPYGLPRDASVAWFNANQDYSIPGVKITSATAARTLISAAQILFLRAEAAALGWIPANSAADYYDAVKASMEWWGITNTTAINAYLASGSVSIGTAYGASSYTNIYLQKYISLFMNGYESWAEWRRTGVPALTPASGAVNVSKKIPRRVQYGSDEIGVNRVNYLAAVAGIPGGDDNHDAKVWWDK
ncbi:MAG: SusD/RagB family nutrient-binding outer membrane lipoprotein [Bacteroidota bacterium]